MLFQLGKFRYNLSNDKIIDLSKTFAIYSNGQLFIKPNQLIALLRSEGIYLD
jgi:hypothetical protein